jgi:hypothetical protein
MRRPKIVNKIYELAAYAGEETGGLVGHLRIIGGEDQFSGLPRDPPLPRAIYLELIPTCRPANFISAELSPLAPAGHPRIATLLAAIALSRHGSNHSHKTLIVNGLNP